CQRKYNPCLSQLRPCRTNSCSFITGKTIFVNQFYGYMKKIALPALLLLAACQNEEANKEMELKYPETRKAEVTDDYFGTQVPDPYRWLENDTSPETEAWVRAQNEVTQAYLATIPYRDK